MTGRLTAYPTGLAGAPNVRSVSFTASPGGPTLAAAGRARRRPHRPDRRADGDGRVRDGRRSGAGRSPSTAAAAGSIAGRIVGRVVGRSSTTTVPGGEGSIPEVLRSAPATPLIALIALLTAGVLGAGHALTPGHGKTLMAAYLVGTRGTPRHAVGLGLAVSVSHTLGILGLAAVVLAAESTLPPDLVVRVAPLVAAVSIVARRRLDAADRGPPRLAARRRRARARRRAPRPRPRRTATTTPHEHAHDARARPRARRTSTRTRPRTPATSTSPTTASSTRHGGVRHRHVPPAGSTISWRSLFVLGLAGGLVPSASALLILLATIAAGRPAWGVVLVAAFGLGMAAVMTGVGLAFVHARGAARAGAPRVRATRAVRLVPAGAAVLVLAVGVVLTTQALSVVGLG